MAVTRFPKLHGGAPALDFVNTVDPRVGPDAEDFVASPAALSAWAEYARLARSVRVTVGGFERAIEVREALYRVFVALAHAKRPSSRDVAHVHREHALVFAAARLVHRSGGYAYDVSDGVDAILWPILESARELLADPSRIKECPGDNCGWVFLDTSRNATRRWCSMASCGARAKMRRYRARVRS